MAEREAALGEPVVDADRLERLERVALQRDAVADAAELGAQVDEDDLDVLLPECEREHAAGDATADDEYALDRSVGHRVISWAACSANIEAFEPVIQPTTWSRSVPAAGTSATFLPRLRMTIRSATS